MQVIDMLVISQQVRQDGLGQYIVEAKELKKRLAQIVLSMVL